MTWLSSRATGATNAASISGCDLLREVQRNLTRTMA
ncbi:ORFS345C.iORF1 [Human betaherpesvirus 5]|nr:ORFS345C.iORF1 [Human betaherpesvirus 5]QHX40707.1 ORFS345C.iORF1 [Human betaherpesvirus 5]